MNKVIGAIALIALSSCNADQVLTPEEKANYEQMDHQIEVARKEAEGAKKDAEEYAKAYANAKTDEERLAVLTAFEASIVRFNENAKMHDQLAAEQDKMTGDAVEKIGGPIRDLAGSLIPGANWIANLIWTLGVPLMFKRSREHLITGVKNLGTGKIGEFLADLARTYGLKHSSDDPIEVIHGAIAAAEKEGTAVSATVVNNTVVSAIKSTSPITK